MPEGAVYVGRPTKWGNPYRVGVDGDLEEVLEKFEAWLDRRLAEDPHFLDGLKGRDLVCWCPLDRPCHADVILRKLSTY
jgi:hypothetical protein